MDRLYKPSALQTKTSSATGKAFDVNLVFQDAPAGNEQNASTSGSKAGSDAGSAHSDAGQSRTSSVGDRHMENTMHVLLSRRDTMFTKQRQKEEKFQLKRRRDAESHAARSSQAAKDQAARMQMVNAMAEAQQMRLGTMRQGHNAATQNINQRQAVDAACREGRSVPFRSSHRPLDRSDFVEKGLYLAAGPKQGRYTKDAVLQHHPVDFKPHRSSRSQPQSATISPKAKDDADLRSDSLSNLPGPGEYLGPDDGLRVGSGRKLGPAGSLPFSGRGINDVDKLITYLEDQPDMGEYSPVSDRFGPAAADSKMHPTPGPRLGAGGPRFTAAEDPFTAAAEASNRTPAPHDNGTVTLPPAQVCPPPLPSPA
jgi:hypothetical protein